MLQLSSVGRRLQSSLSECSLHKNNMSLVRRMPVQGLEGKGLLTLLFYHIRSENVLRNGFFQMTALFLSSSFGMDLTSETDRESES